MSKLFVIYYTPGPAWQADKPFSEQRLLEHGKYMKQLYDNGQLTHGGPFLDSSGGLSIIQAGDLESAGAIVAADPAVLTGVFKASLHPWFSVNWDTYST